MYNFRMDKYKASQYIISKAVDIQYIKQIKTYDASNLSEKKLLSLAKISIHCAIQEPLFVSDTNKASRTDTRHCKKQQHIALALNERAVDLKKHKNTDMS